MPTSTNAPWLYVASAIRTKCLWWASIGIGLGLAHLLLWSKDHSDTLALGIWQDNVAMSTLFCLTIFLMVSGTCLYRFRARPFHRKVSALVEPLIKALTQLASISAQITSGVGLVALFSGGARHTPLIIVFLLYLVSMMEVTTSLWRLQGFSKAAPYLVYVLIITPFVAGNL